MAKRRYDSVKGEFEGESENWSTKTGKKSKAEQAAQQKVKATGEQQYAIDASTGAIETKGGMEKAIKDFMASKKTVEPAKEEVAPAPAPEAPAEDESKKPWGNSGKFNLKQANTAKSNIKTMLGSQYDEEFWTDEMVEEFMESNPDIYKE